MTADKPPKPPVKPEAPKALNATDGSKAPGTAASQQPATQPETPTPAAGATPGAGASDKAAGTQAQGQRPLSLPQASKGASEAAKKTADAGASSAPSAAGEAKASDAVVATQAPDNLRNHFLLAMPIQGMSYFANTLTLVCEHTEEGAMGLVINRPSKVPVNELLAQLGIKTNSPATKVPVIEGGPVSPERAFILHSDDKKFAKSQTVAKGLALTVERDVLDAIAAGEGPKNFLVALGYAGWGKGQLDEELKQNVWLTCPADAEIIFTAPFSERLNKAAAAMGIDLRLMSGQAGHA